MRAAFDFPEQPPGRDRRCRGQFSRPPREVLVARTRAEVPTVLAAAAASALAGNWVLGGVSYPDSQPIVPAAYFEVYEGDPEPWPEAPAQPPSLDWRPDATPAIEAVLEHIAAGDCYQVNLTTRWRAPESDLYRLFCGLAAAQPGGYALYLAGAGVASVSPELFFDLRERRLVTQPMKGTAEAGSDPAVLLSSPKERAENLMIVDLLRNDLGRVCRPGSVLVERLFELHRLPTVWQLTSTVSGELRPEVDFAEAFDALFPCGSVTGAPKLAAMGLIDELETSPRGWYCGALGLLRPGGEVTLNVAIRTVTATAGELTYGVGSGIVADSRPASELAEWRAKTALLGGVPLRGLETMLLADGEFVRLPAHLDRLARTCAALGLELDLEEVSAALAAAASPTGRHRVRLVAGGGPPEVTCTPAPPPGEPVVLGLAAEPLPAGLLTCHKTTHREHYRRLLAQAPAGVFDVICFNEAGLTECTTGNLAVRLDGRWYTPPESTGLLPGVLRAELLAAGELTERTLWPSDLDRAEGLAFLNSLRGWCPATRG